MAATDLSITNKKFVRVGSIVNSHIYDGDRYDGGLETDDVIKAGGAPVADEDVLRLVDVGDIVGDVIGPAASTDNAIARWDGVSGKKLDTSLVYIDDSGNVGIGTTSPDNLLHIAGAIADTEFSGIVINFTRNAASYILAEHVDGSISIGAGGNTDDLIIQKDHNVVIPNGNVGIGTKSPSANADLTLEGGVLCIKETTTPTADANYGKLYTKNDNKLYFQDGAGTEHEVDFV